MNRETLEARWGKSVSAITGRVAIRIAPVGSLSVDEARFLAERLLAAADKAEEMARELHARYTRARGEP